MLRLRDLSVDSRPDHSSVMIAIGEPAPPESQITETERRVLEGLAADAFEPQPQGTVKRGISARTMRARAQRASSPKERGGE